MITSSNSKYFWPTVLTIFALSVSWPLFSVDKIVTGHDCLFSLLRIEGIKESLLGGQFPVRLTGYSLNGYGELSSLFYPNLFYYIPVLMRLCGVPLIAAYNIFYILVNISTAFVSYWSFSRIFNSNFQGAIFAMIYTGFLYRIVDMYPRSAGGEALAMVFVPLALTGLWLTLHRSGDYWPAAVLGFTGVLQSHILSSLMIICVAVIITICSYRQIKENVTAISKIAIFTTLLNLWFYVPFINFYHQIQFNIQSEAALRPHLLSSSVYAWDSGARIQLFCGYLLFAIIFVFIGRYVLDKIKHREQRFNINYTFWFMLIIGIGCSFAGFSRIVCHIIEMIPLVGKHVSVLQFPFRFMVLGSIAISYCVTVALFQMTEHIKKVRTVLIVCCALIAQINMLYLAYAPNLILSAQKINYFDSINAINRKTIDFSDWHINSNALDKDMLEQKGLRFGYLDYVYSDISYAEFTNESLEGDMRFKFGMNLNDWLQSMNNKISNLPFDDIRPKELISNFHKAGMKVIFDSHANEDTSFTLPLYYYPLYEAYTSDGRELQVYSGERHRLMVEVPAGETNVTVKYNGRFLWKIFDVISLLGLISFLYYCRRTAIKNR